MKYVATQFALSGSRYAMSIISYFDIDINSREVISVIGGGGKTTTIFKLASELKQLNRRVLITTTTAMYNPCPDLYDRLVIIEDEQIIEESLEKGTITVLGRNISPENKLLGLDSSFIDAIYMQGFFDFILVEADGSKKRPIKAPALHEPVIPDSTCKTIGVVGIDSLGKLINEANVHRPEIFTKVTNSALGDIITEEIIGRLVISKDGLFKGTPTTSKRYLLLNKVDNELQMQKARFIGNIINDKGFSIDGLLAGSMANKRLNIIKRC